MTSFEILVLVFLVAALFLLWRILVVLHDHIVILSANIECIEKDLSNIKTQINPLNSGSREFQRKLLNDLFQTNRILSDLEKDVKKLTDTAK